MEDINLKMRVTPPGQPEAAIVLPIIEGKRIYESMTIIKCDHITVAKERRHARWRKSGLQPMVRHQSGPWQPVELIG